METLLTIYQKQMESCSAGETAIHWADSRLNKIEISWKQFEDEVSLRAAFLDQIGCQPGQRVFIFLEPSIEIWYFFWAALQRGAVPCVLFPDFGADALSARLAVGKPDYLIIDRFREKTAAVLLENQTVESFIVLSEAETPTDGRIRHFVPADQQLSAVQVYSAAPSDPAFMIFTSGSTGFPKAVVHSHQCAEAILRSMRDVLGLTESDRFWCTAHPAWVTGTVYGVIGPILAGVELIQYSGNFHAKRWLPILEKQRVTVWYSAPTAFRSLMMSPAEFFSGFDLSALRAVFSIGEPLNPAVYHWGKEVLNREIFDTWFQSEAGTIRIANRPGDAVVPGSMGMAVDDTEAHILTEQDEECAPGTVGRLCLREGWQSCFAAYFGQPAAFESKFRNGFYQTGDLAVRDESGRFTFVGRDDDVINTSGHLVGPFEVESVLLEQAEIAEAGVVAAPDPLLYEKVVAFIALKDGVAWSSELETKLRVAVTTRLSGHAAPKDFYILVELPKNSAGKILRNELRKQLLSEA